MKPGSQRKFNGEIYRYVRGSKSKEKITLKKEAAIRNGFKVRVLPVKYENIHGWRLWIRKK
jgi:hypothetical protein